MVKNFAQTFLLLQTESIDKVLLKIGQMNLILLKKKEFGSDFIIFCPHFRICTD